MSILFWAVANDLEKSILLAAFDFLQWPRSLMVFSVHLPDLDMVEEIVPVCCFADISIVTEDRVEHGSFILDIQQVFTYIFRCYFLSQYVVQQRLSA